MHTNRNRSLATDKASSDTSDADGIAPRNPSEMGGTSGEKKRLPRPGVDRNTGQAIPISEIEWQERVAALEQDLIEIDQQDDTPDEVYEQFMRDLDEEWSWQGRPAAAKPAPPKPVLPQ
jgi:hypothetical protein